MAFDVRLEKTLPPEEDKHCIAAGGCASLEIVGGPTAYLKWQDDCWSEENFDALDTLARNMEPAIKALLDIEDAKEAGTTARAVINRDELEQGCNTFP